MKKIVMAVALALLVACGKSEPVATPLPTKERTIGRVQEGLQKADEEAAKRRAAIDEAAK